MPHLRLLSRTLMLVLIAGGLLDRAATLGAHCARHTHPDVVMHEGSATLHQSSSLSVLVPSGHQCPHCPPAECASALPCASGSSNQSAPSGGLAVASLPVDSLREPATAQRAVSAHYTPPTPPPQAAA